ncbi:maltokinase N-terminal cap-like domain-containing protein [Streptomyces sp. WZ-12]|uniref:maltokinase N-terminal cap-like domain-containing protein n=1 Tax=Streptomyces sp. WZ-12 TaxID=3030210 RepID=UPI002381236F|nr:1,4-alpha-glucan branching protein [Streptomyces sp. WZ-12]
MAVIHETTLKPTKLELLTAWLPDQPWYAGSAQAPELARAGGFRLDDPQGEVGIEFVVVTDRSGGLARAYLVPFTYRGAPLDGAEAGLVGTMEHGVLGRRWVYDGTHDPVLVAQLLAFVQGRVEAQAQNSSDARDDSVVRWLSEAAGIGAAAVVGAPRPVSGPHGTDVTVETAVEGAAPGGAVGAGPVVGLHVRRVLEPLVEGDGPGGAAAPEGCLGSVTAVWRAADGTEQRGVFATVSAGAR